MEELYANLHYRVVDYIELIKTFNAIKDDKKGKQQILKKYFFTILFNLCFNIMLPASILLFASLCMYVFTMYFLDQTLGLIPFDLIHPDWLRSIFMHISRFFVLSTPNKTLTVKGSQITSTIGTSWLFIGSFFLWRSMLIFNIYHKTGAYNPKPYQRGFIALLARLFIRCCKFSYVTIMWPFFLLLRLPKRSEYNELIRYEH